MPRFNGTPIQQSAGPRFGGRPVGEKVQDVELGDGDVLEPRPIMPAVEQSTITVPVRVDEGLLPSHKPGKAPSKAMDFLAEAGDVALGAVEGPLAVASGATGFLTSMPFALSEALSGAIAGEPVKGMAEGGKVLDELMGVFSYTPRSEFGKTIAEVAASPFTIIQGVIEESFRDKAWVDSLSPDQRRALSEGRIGDPKALKERWQQENPEAGSEAAKAAQFAFDAALTILPALKGKVERGEVLKPEEVKEVGDAIEKVAPETPTDVVDTVLEALKKEVPAEPEVKPVEIKVEGNKGIVDALLEEADKRTGPRKLAYKRAAKKIAALDKAANELGMKEIKKIKGIGPKTSAVIEEVLKKGEGPAAPGGKSLPEKLSEAIDKPEQVETLKQMGITDEGAQVEQIIRDGVIQKLDAAEALEARGKIDAAAGIKREAENNAEKLKAAGDEKVKELVDGALGEKVDAPEKVTFYHGSPEVFKSSTGMPEGHRGYFATEDLRVAEKFGPNIHKVELDTRDLFDYRDPRRVEEFLQAYATKRNIPNLDTMRGRISRGDYTIFEDHMARYALEDLGYKGNWQIEDGANVIRVFDKKDFNIVEASKPTAPEPPPVKVSEFPSIKIAKEAGYAIKDKRRFTNPDSARKVAEGRGEGFEVVKIGKKYAVGKKISEVDIPKFESLEVLEREYDVGTEIPKDVAIKEVAGNRLGDVEFGVAQVGDKYYRTTTKLEMPEPAVKVPPVEEIFKEGEFGEPTTEELRALEKEIRELEKAEKAAPPEEKGRTVEDLIRVHKQWKKRYVEKINAEKAKEVKPTLYIADVIKDFSTAREAIDWIAENSSNESYKAVAERIAHTLDDVDLIVTEDGVKVEGGAPVLLTVARGVTDTNLNTGKSRIFLKGKSFKDHGIDEITVLHEAIHAATVAKIREGNLVKNEGTELHRKVQELYKLQNKIITELNKRYDEGTMTDYEQNLSVQLAASSTKELVAWGLTDPKFQEMLRSIKVKGKTLWSDFVEAVRKILGIEKNDSNALSELIRITDEIIEPASVKRVVKKPEDLAPIEDNFATFKSKEEAEAYRDAKGIDGEIITDPLTGESYIEPVMRELDDYKWEESLEDFGEEAGLTHWSDDAVDMGEISDSGLKTLVDIINNERGSVDITPLKIHVEKMEEIVQLAKKLGKDLDEFLDGLGMSPEMIEKFKLALAQLPEDKKKVKDMDPINEGILHPDPGTVVYQHVRKSGKGVRKFAPITTDVFKATFSARKVDWKPTRIGRFMAATETRIHAFERYGKRVKEIFFDSWVKKATEAERERKAQVKEVKALAKTLSRREREELNIYAYAQQKGGKEALEASGVKEIPTSLNPRQQAVYDAMRERYNILWDRINYVRGNIGLAPLPKLDNYFPFIRRQNALRRTGVRDSLVFTPVKKFQGTAREFKGIFFPFEKKRRPAKIPIELDIFDGYNTYLSYAMKEIHLAPIAALAKEVAGRKIKLKKMKSGIKLMDVNPGLARLLLEWSDEIMGIDPVSTVMSSKHPLIAQKFSELSRNLVAGMIFGNIGTVLKQPTAIKGVYSMTTFPDVIYGITRTMAERPWKLGKTEAARKSNVLEIRRAELILAEFTEAVQLGRIAGAKKVAGMVTAAPMNIVDALTAEAAWNAGYRFAKKKLKLDEEKAVQWADDLVTKTQALGIKGAVSPIQTTGALKWLTLLQTYTIADFNFLARDVLGIKNPDITKATQVKRVLRYVVGGALINAAFQALGMDPPNPSPIRAYTESKEEGDVDSVALAKAAKELFEVVPVFGGSFKYDSSMMGPLGELASEVPEAFSLAVSALDWDGMSEKEKVRTGLFIGKVLGFYYGVPMTNQLVKSIRTAIKGGTPYETILGVYIEEKRKKGGLPSGPPRFQSGPPIGP